MSTHMKMVPYTPDPDPGKNVEGTSPEAKKEKKRLRDEAQRLRDEQFDTRVISVEVVDAFNFTNVEQACTQNIGSVKATLKQMQQCSKKSVRMINLELYVKTGARQWLKNPDLVQSGIELPEIDSDGEAKFDVAKTYRAWCPCLPEAIYGADANSVKSRYNARVSDLMAGRTTLPDPKKPIPTKFRGRAVEFSTDGHIIHLTVPLRTGNLCAWARTGWAKKNPELAKDRAAPCVQHVWTKKHKDGHETQQDLRLVRGVPGSVQSAHVTLKGIAQGRKTHAILQELLNGTAQYRDMTLYFQGTRTGKECLMAKISYRSPKVAKAEGQTAVVLYSHTNLYYMVAEDGKTSRDHVEPAVDKIAMFDAQRKRAKSRVPPEILADGGAAALAQLRDMKNQHYWRGKHARWAVTLSSGGHGYQRRYRNVSEISEREKNWINYYTWQVANAIVRRAVERGIAHLHVVKWQESLNEEIPRDARHLMLYFPRGAITEKLKQVAARRGVTVEEIDKEPLETLRCPKCNERLPWSKTGRSRCKCGFVVWRDYWRGLKMLESIGINVDDLVEDILRVSKEAEAAKVVDQNTVEWEEACNAIG